MRTKNTTQPVFSPGQTPAPHSRITRIARIAHCAFIALALSILFTPPAFAATVWTKASEIMKDVYNQIVIISTVAAIVTASVALLMMNFSRSGRTVGESRAWLYHGLYYSVFCGRPVERLISPVSAHSKEGEPLWAF